MCQCRFTDYNKDHCGAIADNRGDWTSVGTGDIWELSVLSLTFTVNLKLLQKK